MLTKTAVVGWGLEWRGEEREGREPTASVVRWQSEMSLSPSLCLPPPLPSLPSLPFGCQWKPLINHSTHINRLLAPSSWSCNARAWLLYRDRLSYPTSYSLIARIPYFCAINVIDSITFAANLSTIRTKIGWEISIVYWVWNARNSETRMLCGGMEREKKEPLSMCEFIEWFGESEGYWWNRYELLSLASIWYWFPQIFPGWIAVETWSFADHIAELVTDFF